MRAVRVNYSGMRPGSLDYVRGQRARNETMRPITITVYPKEGAVLTDGRHRFTIARERKDPSIDAVVRVVSQSGRVVLTRRTKLPLS